MVFRELSGVMSYPRTNLQAVEIGAVESVHKSSDSDSSIFKTPTPTQYVLIMVNLLDISLPPRESSGYCLDL
jgi:hypothetical protein